THGGNSEGACCMFPFVYQNTTYNSCTNTDASNGQHWCATTGNYEQDQKWGYCQGTG
ncbi:predicted protein, partial [Nematostella vectensis]